MKRFSLTPLALTLALLLQGCVTYQHPQPVEAQDALKDASQQAAQDVVIPADVHGVVIQGAF